MKTVKMFLLSFVLTALSLNIGFANNGGEDDAKTAQELRTKIVKLLAKSDQVITKDERSAVVKFIVSPKDEIVVVGVATEHDDIDNFIKEKLNYEKVDVEGVKNMKTYAVKVTFKEQS